MSHLPNCRPLSWTSKSAVNIFVASMTAVFMLATPKIASAQEPISYQVSFDEAQAHYVHVTATVVPPAAESFELFMPTWTPGSYLIREYARHLDRVTAIDAEGNELAVEKTTKNRWKISNSDSKPVAVSYRVYCNELSVRTNFADSEFAILNGAATFLTHDSYLDHPHEVKLQPRREWKTSSTALPRSATAPAHQYVAENFDQLVDSPILVGNPTIYPFEVGGATHYLVNQGGDPFWNGAEAAADAAKIVEEHQKMWGVVPYKNYHFINLIAESGGGLEHDNSTLLLTSRWSFRNKRSYKSWLGLVSHEFFHTWNVRRLRPRALTSYDYENENYFAELWVAEGVTSYYDDLALARSAITSPNEYLSALSRQITTLQTTPGRTRQSLDESSHDTWIKFYRSNENSKNTTISYYNKGAIAAFLLDVAIRRETNNVKSLDDVMRELFKRFGSGQGYTNADVLTVANEVSGSDLGSWFESSINSTEELDFAPALEWLGLRFREDPESQEDPTEKTDDGVKPTTTEEQDDSKDENGSPWVGVSSSSSGGRVTVSAVTEGAPGFLAGINVDDELIAINGYRISSSLTQSLSPYKPGEAVAVQLARRGKILELDLELIAEPRKSWSLVKVKKPSNEQQANFAAWLHVEIEAKVDEEVEVKKTKASTAKPDAKQ